MKDLAVAIVALCCAACGGVADAEPAWPEHLDVDLQYRNAAVADPGRPWDFRLGIGFEREPTFQGSDRSQTELDPVFLAAYRGSFGNVFFSGNGLGYSRMLTPNFAIALQLEAEDTREIDDDDRLQGLGDQDEELELEIIGRYFSGPWQLGASVALATGDKGVVWFVGGGYTLRLADDRLFITFSADLSGSDQTNQQTDFGITQTQSQNSTFGYPVYTPGGGLKSFGVGVAADYQVAERWFAYAEFGYERLLGDVADSPLVTLTGSENNIEAGAGFYFRF